jgi:hypothetical protein
MFSSLASKTSSTNSLHLLEFKYEHILSPTSDEKEPTQNYIENPKITIETISKPVHLTIHKTIIERLDQFITSNKIPHIIFHGTSGSGKLTIVRNFIQKIYHYEKSKIQSNVMTVNCSHGKGIQFIREDLKFFAKTNIQTKSGTEFKTILLLNAHHLTVDAQSALRRCIELFSYNTRFFIVVENKNKLLNPILSRFCEIYVPEHIDEKGDIVNLHQYCIDIAFPFQQNMERIVAAKICGTFDSSQMMEVANELYESGVSCIDVMKWAETSDRVNAIDLTKAMMCFHCVKSQIRCEKLLIFYMLDFMFLSDKRIPNV